ncbi:MAG: hypothetical protein K2H98_04610, partial [Duncaniella sp.]|nr:hypothetical protein [Duncaniella sp.]
RYRCFDQDLAEFSGSWSCRTYPTTKLQQFFQSSKSFFRRHFYNRFHIGEKTSPEASGFAPGLLWMGI